MPGNIITVNFSGDELSVRANTGADLRSPQNAALVGYDADKVEFVRDGEVINDATELTAGDYVSVRTKANSKG